MTVSILVNTTFGLNPIQLDVPLHLTVSELAAEVRRRLPGGVPAQNTYLTTQCGRILPSRGVETSTVAQVFDVAPTKISETIRLRLQYRLRGGKGGFGSMLRAQGGRMSRKRREGLSERERDSMRDLDGRRLRSVRQAKELVEFLEKLPETQRKEMERKKAKLRAIIERGQARSSGGSSSSVSTERFSDDKFLEQCEEEIEQIRASVEYSVESSSGDEEGMGSSEDEADTGNEDDNGSSPVTVSSGNSEGVQSDLAAGKVADKGKEKIGTQRPRFAAYFDDEEEDE